MNLCTIATEGVWLDLHAARWLRYVRENVPDAVTHLIVAGKDTRLFHPHHPVAGGFDKVRAYGLDVADRPWFNEVRMGACELFGVDEMVYVDADADVLDDLSGLHALMGDKRLGWVRSPILFGEWANLGDPLGLGRVEWVANNCLLVMRGDFTKEYVAAREELSKYDSNPRVRGTYAFNLMLHRNPGCWVELPGEYGVCWWDCAGWESAKVIQYVNDKGKAKRERLEKLRRAMA